MLQVMQPTMAYLQLRLMPHLHPPLLHHQQLVALTISSNLYMQQSVVGLQSTGCQLHCSLLLPSTPSMLSMPPASVVPAIPAARSVWPTASVG